MLPNAKPLEDEEVTGELLLPTSRWEHARDIRRIRNLWRPADCEQLRPLGHYRREYRKLFQEAWLKLWDAEI